MAERRAGPRHDALLVVAFAATSALVVVLGVTDPDGTPRYPTKFLVWNLLLAWVPFAFALWFARARRRTASVAAGLGWLAFLPNAPYLVTDLVHLGDGGRGLWRHVLQFGFAAWTGVLLGVASVRLVHERVTRRFGPGPGWAVVVATTALCAVGVVIGRFQRWNSWDLVTRPGAVVATTVEWVRSPIADVRSTGVAVAVAAFFLLAYVTVWALAPIRRFPR